MFKTKAKKITIILSFLVILISFSTVNAVEISTVEYTDEYKQWLELSEDERQNLIVPKMLDVKINSGENKIITKIKTLMNSLVSSKFDLRDYISNNLKIRNQGKTNACWAFATLSSLETNLALNSNKEKIYDFSESHMDYSTSQSFTDGEIKNGFSRDVSNGGNFQIGAAYLTNGQGAVSEESMPFISTMEDISINDIKNKEKLTKVTDTEEFGFMQNVTLDSSELSALMLKMKEHIKENGSISAGIHGAKIFMDCYNNETGAIYCKDSKTCEMDHNISIIGWDDNYSKDNFNENNRPTKNGAWVIRNSWGDEINGEALGDNGFMYVSYEDVNIYTQLFGIEKAVENIDYDNIYQYNELGYNKALNLSTNNVYIANVFDRDKNVNEELTEVSLNVIQNVKCKVYVNSKNDSKSIEDLKEVELKEGKTETFDAGYHTLEFKNPIKLTGEKFVVVIQIQPIDDDNTYCITLEKTKGDFFDNVITKENVNYITFGENFSANRWIDTVKDSSALNLNPSNLTIKAFTQKVETIPTATPTPTTKPTATAEPTIRPTATTEPTIRPTATTEPTIRPTTTAEPTTKPTTTAEPTTKPTATAEPTTRPTTTVKPTTKPTATAEPITRPTATIKPIVTSSNTNKIISGTNINNNSNNNEANKTITDKSSLPYVGKTEIMLGLIILLCINMIIVYKKYKKIY